MAQSENPEFQKDLQPLVEGSSDGSETSSDLPFDEETRLRMVQELLVLGGYLNEAGEFIMKPVRIEPGKRYFREDGVFDPESASKES